MKERPILFTAPMVRGLLAGTKTQTRRVVKQESPDEVDGCCWVDIDGVHQFAWTIGEDQDIHPSAAQFSCPYGQPGDRLWVRETFGFSGSGYIPDIHFRATNPEAPILGRWHPSIHMRRIDSRITLEITSVRVERLQCISFADAAAEGLQYSSERLDRWSADGTSWRGTPQHAYRELWESINGPASWDANPWVWAIEFRRLP